MKGPERYIKSRNQWVARTNPEIQSATITVRGVSHTFLENDVSVSRKDNGTLMFYHMYRYLQGEERMWGRWYKNGLPQDRLPSLENPTFEFEMTGYEVDFDPLNTATAAVRITFTERGVRQLLKGVGSAT